MRPSHRRVRIAVWIALALTAAAPGRGEAPPRYNLRVGDWLVYERNVAVRLRDESVTRSRDQLQLWCFAQQDDERLVLVDRIANVGEHAEPLTGMLIYVDSSGRIRIPPESIARLDELESALFLIPPLQSALEAGPAWQSAADIHGRLWRCKPSQTPANNADERVFDFEIEDPTGAAAALGLRTRGRFRFDLAGGVVSKIEVKQTDDRLGTQSESMVTLKHRVKNEDRWCAQRADEAERFRRAAAQELALSETLLREPDAVDAHAARLDRIWESFVVDTDARAKSPLRAVGVGRVARLADDKERLRRRAAAAARWLNHRVPAWSLQNESGVTVSSDDLRGRVIVECFWSVESAAAVRALETMRKLAAELTPGQAEMICLNIDDDLSAAMRAIRGCGGGLSHALGSSLREAEGLDELPVFRVRDREGTVRAIFIGWRPSITDVVAPLIR